MSKQCSNCGNMNDDLQNFCTNCGNSLSQPISHDPNPEAAFVPVSVPPPAQTPPLESDWQAPAPQSPPPAGEWQTPPQGPPPAGAWQAPPQEPPQGPPQGPPPGYYYPPQGQPSQGAWNKGANKTDFNETKGMFMDMINAHKTDAGADKEGEDLPQRKYPALKLLMSIARVLSWINAGLVLLGGLGMFISVIRMGAWWMGLLILPISIVFAFLALVFTYAALDSIRLFINIEDNTRRTANK
jgi:hypothetical protein